MAVIPYPIIMNGLFLPILSLQYPENALIKDAVLSAIPSISDIEVFDAPIDIRKRGITLYIIFVDVSVKKLVNPVKKTFLCKPNILLFSILRLSPGFGFLQPSHPGLLLLHLSIACRHQFHNMDNLIALQFLPRQLP